MRQSANDYVCNAIKLIVHIYIYIYDAAVRAWNVRDVPKIVVIKNNVVYYVDGSECRPNGG